MYSNNLKKVFSDRYSITRNNIARELIIGKILYFKIPLILIVSLEAIILMILLLMAQNRKSIRDDIREEEDLRVDLESVDLLNDLIKRVRRIESAIKKLKK